MNKIYLYLSAALVAVNLASCGGKEGNSITPSEPDKPTTGVEVTISTATIETKAAVLEFGSNAKMNIFAKTFGRIDAPNIVDNVVATFDGAGWKMSPAVYINDTQKNAFVYAVAPYDASYIDPAKIPVDLNKQVDLMYSGYYVPASLNSPNVKLTMYHALSLLSFNIVPVNYNGQGNLTSLAINGTIIYSSGTMDASSGKITLGDKGEVKATFNKSVLNNSAAKDMPGLWVLPFNTKTGTVTLTAVIDGKTLEATLPEVEVKTAWQYVFRLALTSSGLEFDPSKTETLSLNVTSDQPVEFNGYGKVVLTASGSTLTSPQIDGDAVFGTLSTPGKNASYTGSTKVEGLKSGDKVVVESWNSDGFTLESLEGVQTIDISEYE